MTKEPVDSIPPKTRGEWRQWLEKNHVPPGKDLANQLQKGTGKPRFDYYDEAVQEQDLQWETRE